MPSVVFCWFSERETEGVVTCSLTLSDAAAAIDCAVPPDKLEAAGVEVESTCACGIKSAEGGKDKVWTPGGSPGGKGGIPDPGGGWNESAV